MFARFRRSPASLDAERLKGQVAEVGAALSDASVHGAKAAAELASQAKKWAAPRAKDAAGQAKDWAAPRAKDAVEWATPRAKDAAAHAAEAAEHAVEWATPRAKDAAAHAAEWATPRAKDAATQAAELAEHAVEWATPRVEAAVEWATPRVEKALSDAAEKAGPAVEKAAGKAYPYVDVAHDRFVDEVLPKVAAVVGTAMVAAAEGADRARDIASEKLAEIAHLEPPKPPKSHRFAKVFWTLTGIALVIAAISAWQKSKPTTDPWAEQPWEPAEPADRFKAHAAEARGVASDVRHEIEDAAEVVGERAGETVARTRGATEKAKAAAREATEKAKAAADEALEKAKEATSRAKDAEQSADEAKEGGEESAS